MQISKINFSSQLLVALLEEMKLKLLLDTLCGSTKYTFVKLLAMKTKTVLTGYSRLHSGLVKRTYLRSNKVNEISHNKDVILRKSILLCRQYHFIDSIILSEYSN